MPTFWSDVNVDPKRSFRWLFYLPKIVEPFVVRSVKKPSFSVGNIAHQFVNHTFYYPGRVNWNPVDVSFVDPAGSNARGFGDDTSKSILDAIVDSGYNFPDTMAESVTSISKNSAVETFILYCHGYKMKCLHTMVSKLS